jgi:hypothetical protein
MEEVEKGREKSQRLRNQARMVAKSFNTTCCFSFTEKKV